MSNQFKISVLLPVYCGDRVDFLDQAIASLARQSYSADEILILADGPLQEQHYSLIKAWENKLPGLKRCELPENRGMAEALNLGIKTARNEWLARMDADDISLPDRFEKQVRYLKERPFLSILGGWIEEFDENPDQPQAIRKLPEKHEQIASYAQWRCPFNHMTVMYRKSVLKKIGGYKNFGMVGDDYELWARFIKNGYLCANISGVLVKARASADFFSHRRRGWIYFKHELKEINALYSMGLLNPFHYAFHFLSKAAVRLSPPFLVRLIYKFIRLTS